MGDSFESLNIRAERGVLLVQISSPPINLLGSVLVNDLVSLIERLDKGGQDRVVVFSSADPQYFIPHVDVTKIAEYRQAAARLTGEPSLALLFRRLSETKAITIAQIAGRVRGAGSEFALACDMRFASRERAIFGQPEVALGVIPGGGAVQHLSRLMGRARALEVIASADDYDAALAERYGWINRALPDEELEPYVTALAHRIARFPQAALLMLKQRVNAITLASEGDYRRDSELFGEGFQEGGEARARTAMLIKRGLQTRSETELNLGRVLGELDNSNEQTD
jgi:enoyl-CoA hydratase/carnithine racemase